MLEPGDRAVQLWKRFAQSLAIILSIFVSIIVFVPSARRAFSAEDQFLETLTAVLFLFGFLIGSIALIKSRKLLSGWIFFPVFSLVGVLEELSYGARLFGWIMPVFDGVQLDALHDFIDLLGVVGSQNPLVMAALGVVAVFGLVFVFRKDGSRSFLANLRHNVRNAHPVSYALFAMSLLVISSAIDIPFQSGWPLHHWIHSGAPILGVETGLTRRMFFLLEELLEFSVSYAALFSNISLIYWPDFLKDTKAYNAMTESEGNSG